MAMVANMKELIKELEKWGRDYVVRTFTRLEAKINNLYHRGCVVHLVNKTTAQITHNHNMTQTNERYTEAGIASSPHTWGKNLNSLRAIVIWAWGNRSKGDIIMIADDPRAKPDLDRGDIALYTHHGATLSGAKSFPQIRDRKTGMHILKLRYVDKAIEMRAKDVEIYLDEAGKLVIDGSNNAGVKYEELKVAMDSLQEQLNTYATALQFATNVPNPNFTIDISGAKASKIFFD